MKKFIVAVLFAASFLAALPDPIEAAPRRGRGRHGASARNGAGRGARRAGRRSGRRAGRRTGRALAPGVFVNVTPFGSVRVGQIVTDRFGRVFRINRFGVAVRID